MDADRSPAAIAGWLMFSILTIIGVGSVIGLGDYVRAEVQINKTKEANKIKQYGRTTCFRITNHFLAQEGWRPIGEADRFSLPTGAEVSDAQPTLKCRSDDDQGVPYTFLAYELYWRRGVIKTKQPAGDA